MLSSCKDNVDNPNKELVLNDFSEVSNSGYKFSSSKIQSDISEQIKREGILLSIVRHVNKYYSSDNPLIWINRLDVQGRADTLLSVLRSTEMYGISKNLLEIGQIESDIERIYKLDFDEGRNNINHTIARLEHNPTLAYSRYFSIIRFDLVNPDYLYSNFEKDDIFRFDNGFSVFSHDTASPWLFQRKECALSYGCLRVDPAVPLFITYYTIYYDKSGQFAADDDVYGYDSVLVEQLKPFVKL